MISRGYVMNIRNKRMSRNVEDRENDLENKSSLARLVVYRFKDRVCLKFSVDSKQSPMIAIPISPGKVALL